MAPLLHIFHCPGLAAAAAQTVAPPPPRNVFVDAVWAAWDVDRSCPGTVPRATSHGALQMEAAREG